MLQVCAAYVICWIPTEELFTLNHCFPKGFRTQRQECETNLNHAKNQKNGFLWTGKRGAQLCSR